MEQENQTPDTEDLYDREEKCQRAMKTVGRACLMRLLVAALLVFILIRSPGSVLLWGLVGFVLLINLGGMLPLLAELRKRRREYRQLLQEEPPAREVDS